MAAYGQQYGGWGAQAQAQGGWAAQGGQQQQQQPQAQQGWSAQQGAWGQQQQQQQQQPQQQQQNYSQQSGWGQQAQQAQQMQQAPQAQQQQMGQPQANSKDVTLVITGCTHATVGPIVRGTFQLFGENHGKPTYKKDGQVNGLDVMTYYWDERDGAGFCGWWFGPKVGGDQVWAYHTDKSSETPPQTGWKVPYDGPVDPTFVISVKPKGGAGGQQQMQQQQQQPAQQQWNQGQWGQQQQQQGWGQQQGVNPQQAVMQAKMAEEQQKLEEQRRQLEMLRQKQMQENAARQSEARMKQQAEQAKRMEEMRLKQDEANRVRVEEQKKKMEEMKQRQQEILRKRMEDEQNKKAEMEKKRLEQVAVLTIRRVIQKYRAVAPDNHDATKKELDDIIGQHLEACGTQKDRLATEIEQAVAATKQRIEQIEELKRKEEEKKAAELEKKREARDKAISLVKELERLITKAEEKSKAVVEEAEPFNGDKDMTASELESTYTAVQEAGKEAGTLAEAANAFAMKESSAIKNTPFIPGDTPSTAVTDYTKLMVRLTECKKQTSLTVVKCNTAKGARMKKAIAKEKLESTFAVFKKYAKDNRLERRGIKQFAKAEYSFTVPEAVLDTALRILAKDGEKGVAREKFQALKSMIGIAREAAIDEKRRQAKEVREQMISDMKEKLRLDIKKAEELITAASEAVDKADKQTAPLVTPAKAKTMTSVEMVELADETDAVVEGAKAASAKAKDAVAALNNTSEPELKAFVVMEVKKLENNMKTFEQKITKFTQTCSKFRTDAQKKASLELEKLRSDGIAMMYSYMGEKKLDGEGLFKAMDKKKKGKIEEGEFLKFFQANLKTVGDNGDAKALPDEDVRRLFTYLDSDEDGCLPKDKFLSVIRKFMKATKASVITEDISIKSKIIRRLNEGEVLEVITGPTKEESVDVARLRVKAMSDGVDGWVTPIGNQGTVFLEEGGNLFKVVKETILTGSFVIGGESKSKDKKLKIGEICEVREWARKEENTGLMRMKVRVQSDGQIGWATSVGNTGIPFLEMI